MKTSGCVPTPKVIPHRSLTDMIRIRKLVNSLIRKEPQSIVRVMAFMSYNPAIGRVLHKGGVEVFQAMAADKVPGLSAIKSVDDFDRFHHAWIDQFIRRIRNNRGKRCSVGQAQKAINVFLKVYVDWANLPNQQTANRLIRYIHVPLDKILMASILRKFPKFKSEIYAIREMKNYSHSLSKIGQKEYDQWQRFFRELHSAKPVLFDVIWAIERETGSGL
jgi:hypothetical protein